ncbi:hypothetical protein Poli38472_000249 [Pythium oligandrum]|uniref:Cilia- and flagella-associated protein 36 n=1 Tax=Pythium oligandrum TaxID=41045 RepID=A0A8K1CDB3_PYTOL|nr:hypothetical protein Poli38472_000249 [Pythium oligandrum]|eukprot:TMW60207.1 hypothetical protein Poli38472_000249 [Pythium oligandrum]
MAATFDAIDLLTRYETPLLKDMEKEDDVLDWVAAYIGSESFQDGVDAFCEEHGEKFKILMTKGGPRSEDLDAVEEEWKQLHTQFVDNAHAQIEAFLESKGFTAEHYKNRCDEEMRLSEERQRHTRLSFFVQLLTACTDYEQFLNLMRRAADPEYYDKKELQYQAEMIVYEGGGPPEYLQQTPPPGTRSGKGVSSDQIQAAHEFLEFFDQNPSATLEELTEEFQKKLQLA